MSKKITIILFTLLSSLFSESLIHPLDFKGTDKEKTSVIKFIEKNVKETYCDIGMCQDTILRMMEEEELRSFKELTKVKNRYLLNSVIETYCGIGMCNYSTILMMYNEEKSASNKSLEW
tara:strand:- start:2 stop:358 length:357 start_codon:yes stop_codon:yes gene_type:complete